MTAKEYLIKAIAARSIALKCNPEDLSDLLEQKFLKTSLRNDSYVIDTTSDIFVTLLNEIAEEGLNEKPPLKIRECLNYISKFESFLKDSYNDNVFNAFSLFIDPYTVQSLVRIHREGHEDLIAFYTNLLEVEDDNVGTKLWRFEEDFFKALLYIDVDAETTCKLLTTEHVSSERREMHEKSEFVTKLPEIDFERGLQLYKYGRGNGLDKAGYLLALLLAALASNGYKEALSDGVTLFEFNKDIAVVFWGAVKVLPDESIDYVLDIRRNINNDEIEVIRNYIFTLQKILQQSAVTEEQTERIFELYFDFLCLKETSISNSVWGTLTWYIKGHEQKRYDFLMKSLKQSINPGLSIKSYFHNFENPKYFFEFFETTYASLKNRTNMQLFKEGFSHFINSHHMETEKQVLRLLSHENFNIRIGTVKLITGERGVKNKINLLLLETEIEQLRAIEGITAFPFGIEDLIPILINLRKSPFKNVSIHLTNELCILVIEAYPHVAFKIIEQCLTDTVEDKKFIGPIRKCLKLYGKIRKEKRRFDDINPLINEKNHVQLYYKLEAEINAKAMSDIDKDESSMLFQLAGKSVHIVRGNSWKIEGQGVSKLGQIESSIAVDLRMFKNPDDFEMKLNYPKPRF